MTRTKLVILVLGITAIAAVGGWLAGTAIKSPAEAAAQTAAPEPTPILVPVEMRELSTDIITRGTGRFGTPLEIVLAPSLLKPDTRVVTRLPSPGDQLSAGDVLMTVSGRPVFILEGQTPSFRDLGPGLTGPDVLQLEMALNDLGLDVGAVDDTYDEFTAEAVRRLYAPKNLLPVTASADQLSELWPVEAALIGGVPLPGIQLPADEVVFVPRLPVRISELRVLLGEEISGPIMVVTDATVAIDGAVPIESADLVEEGMLVIIDEPDLGISTEGEISRLATGPGTDGVDGFHVYLEVRVPDPPANLINASVRLTIPTESSGGPVLAVPVSALSLATDGTSRVQVSRGGEMVFVEVEPGLSAQGFVAVRPVAGSLVPGDMVVIGFDNQQPG